MKNKSVHVARSAPGFLHSTALAAVLLAAADPAGAGTVSVPCWDLEAEFNATSNPSGAWTYGYSATLGGTFVSFTEAGSASGIDYWTNVAGAATDATPGVLHNPGPTPIQSGTTQLPADGVSLHPGAAGEYAIARFTVPSDGLYDFVVNFSSSDTAGATVDVHALLNDVPMFGAGINTAGGGMVQAFSPAAPLSLAAGDVIDFAVGFGNGSYQFDNTAISATVSRVPEPSVSLLALATTLVVLAGRRRP